MSGTKKEIVILAAVAIGSMAVGFFVVFLLLGPGEETRLPDPFAGDGAGGGPAAGKHVADKGSQKKVVKVSPPEKNPSKQHQDAGGKEPAVEPAPEVPPPATSTPTPSHKAKGEIPLSAGDPFIWRCWPQGSDTHLEKDDCGELKNIGDVLDDNMGIVESCVVDQVGKNASGKLSLALRLDFDDGSIKAWLGNSTTVESMAEISACLRDGFEKVTLPQVAHDHPRYIVFFTIDVG